MHPAGDRFRIDSALRTHHSSAGIGIRPLPDDRFRHGRTPFVVVTVRGATVGAAGSFYIGRRLGRASVERIAGARARRLDGFLQRHGFATVLYLRLIPVVPFNVFNYACGATGVRGRDYCLATAVGVVPDRSLT